MVNFTQIAQDPYRDLALNHELWIAGRDFSNSLIDARVTYNTDVGGSGMQMTLLGEFEGLEDRQVVFRLGYGNHKVPWFVGRLVRARDVEGMNRSDCTAFGPFRVMGEQDIGADETFQGRTLESIVMDLGQRAGHDSGSIEVRGGRRYKLPVGEQFTWDITCLDVLNTVLEKAEFVAMDMPGGKRLVMPRPRAGGNTGIVGTYTPAHYISLGVDSLHATSYYSVVVYRNGDNGVPVVYAERRTGLPAPRRRRYKVADFPGSQAEADDKAYELAESLRSGERSFTMTIPFNPDLILWKGLRIVRVKRRHQLVYTATIDNTVDLTYSPGQGSMEVSGSCYEVKSMRRPVDRAPVAVAVSSGVVQVPGAVDSAVIEETEVLEETNVMVG